MDNINRAVKICRRIVDIEHALGCKDQGERKDEELREELEQLEEQVRSLIVASHKEFNE